MNVFSLRAFLCVFVTALSCWSQQDLRPAPQDTKAVSIIRQALDVAGGIEAIKAIKDYTADGTVNYHLGRDFDGSIAIRGSGLDYLRFDATLPRGLRSEATSHGEVRLKTEEGAVAIVSSGAPLAPPRFVLPYLLLAPVLGSHGYRISYRGIVQLEGKTAHNIEVQLVIPGLNDVSTQHRERFTIDFFIDASTFQVVMMQDRLQHNNTRQLHYSDYRIVGGVSVPFSIEQKGGYPPCSIKLDRITFNRGLQESDFNL